MRPRASRWVGAAVGVSLVLAALAGSPGLTPAHAAVAADWDAGMIITDTALYDATSMTPAQIQTFLDSKGAACQPGTAACLKDYRVTTTTRAADAYCGPYEGAADESAAQVIAKVGTACGINPQVLLALLQKESSLVTMTKPGTGSYQTATGFGCPDNAGCAAQYLGFFNQVYWAARQFKVYAASPASFTFKAQAWNTVAYNPSPACGSSSVYIQNQATASLYNYTPYQPNQAALGNLYGLGDACSAYGNRNFWTLMVDWFLDVVPVTGITLSPESLALDAGDVVQVVAIVEPANASDRALTWTSDDSSVATVSTAGRVTAVSVGTATITATAHDGTGRTASVTVIVSGCVRGTPALPMSRFTLGADMTGDGRGETLAVDAAGTLWAYPGTATGAFDHACRLGDGFAGIQVFGPGDMNSDGKADVFGITPDGNLWMYPGTWAAPLAGRTQVGSGWTGWTLVPAGDLNGDKKADLLGINVRGDLYMFAGKGTGWFLPRVQVGSGWSGWSLYAAGDLNADGRADILGINARGDLYQYTGKGTGRFNARQQAGWGWLGNVLAAGADLNGDGLADILGRNDTSRILYYYQGTGNAHFARKVPIATDW